MPSGRQQPSARERPRDDAKARQRTRASARRAHEPAWQSRVLDLTRDAIFVWELGGTIVYWNRGAELLYGYSAAEAVGRVSHELLRTEHVVPSQIFEALVANEGEWEGELTHRTRDGQLITALSRHQVVREPDGRTYVLESSHDISERKRLEREITARAGELEAIQSVMDVALSHLSLDDLVPELLQRLQAVLAVDNVAILLVTEDGHDLLLRMARGPEEEVTGKVRVPIGRGVAGTIASTRQPLVLDDVSTAHPVNPLLPVIVHSLMGVPLLVEDRLVGVIHAGTSQPHHFEQRELRLLQLVASRIALVIDRLRTAEIAGRARQEAEMQAAERAATFEATADGVVYFDASAHVTQMNTAARKLLGHNDLSTAVHLPAREQDSRFRVRDEQGYQLPISEWPVSRVLRGEMIHSANAVDLVLRTSRGVDIEVSVTGSPVFDADGTVVGAVCAFRDVTERRRLEHRTLEALDALLAMARTLVGAEDVADNATSEGPQTAGAIARQLAELTCGVLGCTRVGILAIEPDTRLQRPLAVVGLAPEQETSWRAELEASTVRYGEGADAEILAQFAAGKAVVIDMTEPPYDQLPNPYGITTSLLAPMRTGHEAVGILSLDYGGERHEFTPRELALAEAVAQLSALTIERERLLRQRTEGQARELAMHEVNQRLDDFIGIAAHDLKSPVASSMIRAQVAARRNQRMAAHWRASDPEVARHFEDMQSSLEGVVSDMRRLAHLTTRLLDVTRVRAGKLDLHPEPSDLSDIVRQCVEEQARLEPERALRLESPDVLPIPVLVDPERISQVVTNFLTNALRYAPAEEPISVTIEATADVARVAVHDEGAGIPASEQERIWARFAQGQGARDPTRVQSGLGLGLYISREIIEQHDGHIGVESKPGAGTTFWFTLPVVRT